MHGHAVAVDHLVGVGQVLLLLLGDGGGVLIAAVVGREYHLAIQLGHYTVLLLHDERVVRGLEAGWEGRGVLADVVGRCVMLLVHAIVGNLLLHVLWVMLERLRHLLLLMLLLLHLCLLARSCCIAPLLGVFAGWTSLAVVCLRVLLLSRLACLLLRLRICGGSTWWAEFGEELFNGLQIALLAQHGVRTRVFLGLCLWLFEVCPADSVRISIEPIAVLEDVFALFAYFAQRSRLGGVCVFSIQISQIFRHEVKHTPVLLHLGQVFHVPGKILF